MAQAKTVQGMPLSADADADSAGSRTRSRFSVQLLPSVDPNEAFDWINHWMDEHEYTGLLLNPASHRMKNWDLWCGVLLLYTAFMTPLEVAFIPTEVETPTGIVLFTMNRAIDLSFFLDIVKTFVTFVFLPDGTRVTRVATIASIYIRHW